MGANTSIVVRKVLLPEAMPALVQVLPLLQLLW